MAWGSTPRNDAVNGLSTLLKRPQWREHPDGQRIRELLRPQLDSGDETIRMITALAITQLFDPNELPGEIERRLRQEENLSVTTALLDGLSRCVSADPEGVDSALAGLREAPNWPVLAARPEDRTVPPQSVRTEGGDLLVSILAYLAFAGATGFAAQLVGVWARHPLLHPATLGRAVAMTRRYMNPPNGWEPESQTRLFAFLETITDAILVAVSSSQELLSSGTRLGDESRHDLEAAAWIANCIAQELYHASGAFQSQQEQQQPDERVVAPRFCDLALPLIEKLGQVPSAGIAHHLVQTLVFLSRREPRRAFLAIASIVTTASGYSSESLGEAEVLGLVDAYVAERRELILGDPECLSALRRMLEAFVGVGSDRAIRRVQDLGDLFR
jgi:hypothetical protein